MFEIYNNINYFETCEQINISNIINNLNLMYSCYTHIFHKKCTEELKVIEISDESYY